MIGNVFYQKKSTTLSRFFLIFLFFFFFVFFNFIYSYDILDTKDVVLFHNVNVIKKNDILFISKSEIVKALSLKIKDDYSFYLNKDLLVTFLNNNSYFSINGKIFNLSFNTFTSHFSEDNTKIENELFIPIKFFSNIVNQFVQYELFNFSDRKLIVDKRIILSNSLSKIDKEKESKLFKGNIRNIEIDDKSNGILIKIYTDKRFHSDDISSYITADNHLNLTLYKSEIDTNHFANNFKLNTNAIIKLVPFQLDKSSQLTFIINRNKEVLSKSISIKDSLISINLFFNKAKEMNNNDIKERLLSSKDRWKIDRIIIDPGHGGKDPGAIGFSGLQEKTITLGIAKYLKRFLLNDNDLRVFITRDDDEFVPLKERTQFANENKGKLFVSIHCNAVNQKRVSGFETYFLSPARTEKAMKVAAKENAAIKYESNSDNYKRLTDDDFIVLSMVQDNFAKESEKWASIVQDEINEISYTDNRGVDQAGFYVLIGASMPSILVEAGFISNPKEERLLKSKSYQKKIARAIYNSIVKLKLDISN